MSPHYLGSLLFISLALGQEPAPPKLPMPKLPDLEKKIDVQQPTVSTQEKKKEPVCADEADKSVCDSAAFSSVPKPEALKWGPACPPAATDAKCVLVHVFGQPAHCPLPRFAPSGQEWPGEGLLIYEGMRLLIHSDGKYQVQATVGVPQMETTLRLQLSLFFPCDSHLSPFQPQCCTLTLPPIRIPVETDAAGQSNHGVFQLFHEGHSDVLRQKYFDLLPGTVVMKDGCNTQVFLKPGKLMVERSGTARFGSLPIQ